MLINILILYLSFSISRRKHEPCTGMSFGNEKAAGKRKMFGGGAGLSRTLKDTAQSNAMRTAQAKGIRFSIQDDGYTLSTWKYLQTFGLQGKLCCNQF